MFIWTDGDFVVTISMVPLHVEPVEDHFGSDSQFLVKQVPSVVSETNIIFEFEEMYIFS